MKGDAAAPRLPVTAGLILSVNVTFGFLAGVLLWAIFGGGTTLRGARTRTMADRLQESAGVPILRVPIPSLS